MKGEIDGYVERYGGENHPPPWQLFTIANDPKAGNLHFVQKVFKGPFEVRRHRVFRRFELKVNASLMSSTRRGQLLDLPLESILGLQRRTETNTENRG